MELFYIYLATSILLFSGAFIFKKKNDYLLFSVSGIMLILLGVGVISNTITIDKSSYTDTYNYVDEASPHNQLEIITISRVYDIDNSNWTKALGSIFILLGLYIAFLPVLSEDKQEYQVTQE